MNPEDALQISIMDWMRLQHPNVLAVHIPNGGSRNKIEAVKLKRMGVKAGMPDIFIPQKSVNSLGFFCELKVGKNTPTPIQKEVMQKLQDSGYYCCIARSLEEFQKEFYQYSRNENASHTG